MVRNLPANIGAAGPIPGSGRFSGEGNGNSLQYSCLGNPTDREAWRATVHRVAKESDVTQQLNNNKMYKIENLREQTAQHKELYSVLCGDLNGEEIQGRRNICICVADSLCSTEDTNTTSLSNYTLILKKKFKKEC